MPLNCVINGVLGRKVEAGFDKCMLTNLIIVSLSLLDCFFYFLFFNHSFNLFAKYSLHLVI